MKKLSVFVLMLILTIVITAGCSEEKTTNNSTGEFLGKYSGEAGTLEFLPDGKVKVQFSPDYIWMIMAGNHNDKIYKYAFITKKNEAVSSDKAEYVTFYKEEGGMIISNPCKV